MSLRALVLACATPFTLASMAGLEALGRVGLPALRLARERQAAVAEHITSELDAARDENAFGDNRD